MILVWTPRLKPLILHLALGKPHLGFYKQVLNQTGLDPHRVIFVDDKLENVLTARSLGLHGIVFPRGGADQVKRALRNLLGDPVLRAQAWLARNRGLLQSVTDTGIVLRENFAQLLILELTEDKYGFRSLRVTFIYPLTRTLIDIVEHPRAWNFFHGT